MVSEGIYSHSCLSKVSLPYLQFQLPVVNHSPKILNGKFRNKELMHFKQWAVLSSVMKSHALQLHPEQHPLGQHCPLAALLVIW